MFGSNNSTDECYKSKIVTTFTYMCIFITIPLGLLCSSSRRDTDSSGSIEGEV